MTTVQVSARIDEKIKLSAQKVLERQGLDLATAIKIFLTKTANDKSFPLDLRVHFEYKNSIDLEQKIQKGIESYVAERSISYETYQQRHAEFMKDLLDEK